MMSPDEDGTPTNNISLGNSLEVKDIVNQVKNDSGLLKERRYFCKICDISFSTFPFLKDHVRVLHTVKPTRSSYFCQSCGKNFPTLSGFQFHMHSEHTIEKIDACIKCNFKLPHERIVPTRRSGDAYPEHYCIVCQEETKDKRRKEKLAMKIQRDGKKKPPFGKDISKQNDPENREKKKILTCELCQVSYGTSYYLNKHLFTKHGVRGKGKPHLCGICQKGFKHLGSLRMHHLRQHVETKSHVCGVCNEKFALEIQLQKHSRRQHPPKKRCDVCLKEVCSSYLQVHMRSHLGIKPYTCVVCDKGFETSGKLKTHFLIHTGEKPHVCETCGRGFNRRVHLKTHLRLHTGEKPYVCDICQRGFNQKWVMYTHRRIHTGERPFECEVCQKGFIYKSQLKTHQLKHCNASPSN